MDNHRQRTANKAARDDVQQKEQTVSLTSAGKPLSPLAKLAANPLEKLPMELSTLSGWRCQVCEHATPPSSLLVGEYPGGNGWAVLKVEQSNALSPRQHGESRSLLCDQQRPRMMANTPHRSSNAVSIREETPDLSCIAIRRLLQLIRGCCSHNTEYGVVPGLKGGLRGALGLLRGSAGGPGLKTEPVSV